MNLIWICSVDPGSSSKMVYVKGFHFHGLSSPGANLSSFHRLFATLILSDARTIGSKLGSFTVVQVDWRTNIWISHKMTSHWVSYIIIKEYFKMTNQKWLLLASLALRRYMLAVILCVQYIPNTMLSLTSPSVEVSRTEYLQLSLTIHSVVLCIILCPCMHIFN